MAQKQNTGLIVAVIILACVVVGSAIYLSDIINKKAPKKTITDQPITESELVKSFAEIEKLQTQLGFSGLIPVRYSDIAYDSRTEPIQGKRNADFSIIEYSDFECPFCREFHSTPLELIKQYPDNLNWAYRHFPLTGHDPEATDLAISAECLANQAGNDAFWQFTDAVFAGEVNSTGNTRTDSLNWVKQKEFDEAKFTTCYDNQEPLAEIQAEMGLGVNLGITGTPNLIVANHKQKTAFIIPGALDTGNFSLVLEILGVTQY